MQTIICSFVLVVKTHAAVRETGVGSWRQMVLPIFWVEFLESSR